MTIRTLIFASSQEALDALRRELPLREDHFQVMAQSGGVSELCRLIVREDLELAVVSLPQVGGDDLARIETALSVNPKTAMILLSGDQSSEFLMRAMRAGVREIVPLDGPKDALSGAFMRQASRLDAAKGRTRLAQVVAFMPAKGGSGSTFLATNLGFVLASHGKRVAVLDLNLQFGDVALFVSDKRPKSNVADVCREAHRLDAEFLEASMMNIGENLSVLAAPDSPERAPEVRPEIVERIIALARARFDIVILDVGRILEAVSIKALDEAETINLVVQAALPTLHDARRLLGVLQGLGYGKDKLKIVLNRIDKKGDIGVREVARTLGYDVAQQVPNSYVSVVHSINHGIPILRHAPTDPVAQALVDWAEQIDPTGIDMSMPAQAQGQGGWFGKVLGRS